MGPLHFISAVTGWELEANIEHLKNSAISSIKDIQNIINNLKDKIKNTIRSNKANILIDYLDIIQQHFISTI